MTVAKTAMENVKFNENEDVDKKQAGAFIRQQREAKGLSRDKLGEITGYSRNAIYLLEAEGVGSNELISALADALGFIHSTHHNFSPKQ